MDSLRSATAEETSSVLRRIESSGWVLLGILFLLAFLWRGVPLASALGVGGVAALSSFRLMDLYFARIFRGEVPRPKWWHHALYAARFLGLLGVVALALGWLHLSATGLAVGLSVPILSIVIYGAVETLRGVTSARA